MIIGIDYGSKKAGTTVLALLDGQEIVLYQSEKNRDADQFLADHLRKIKTPATIGFDAPLSLPGVYASINNCTNFHYRQCDREVGAMSPMFLGGLTARAMQLKHENGSTGLAFYETYPALQAKRLDLQRYAYKKATVDYSEIQIILKSELAACSIPQLQNSHQVDAILALLGAYRIEKGIAEQYGNPEEGLIFV